MAKKKNKKVKYDPTKLGKDYVIREEDMFDASPWGIQLMEETGATILSHTGFLEVLLAASSWVIPTEGGLYFHKAEDMVDKVGTKRTDSTKYWTYLGNIYDQA